MLFRSKPHVSPEKHRGFEATLTTHRTTHQGPRQRTRRRSTCRHGHAWIGTESQSNWPKMQKTLVKPGFYQRRGQEPNNPRIPWENRSLKTRRRKIRRAPQNILCAGSARDSAPAKPTFQPACRFIGSRLLARSEFIGSPILIYRVIYRVTSKTPEKI